MIKFSKVKLCTHCTNKRTHRLYQSYHAIKNRKVQRFIKYMPNSDAGHGISISICDNIIYAVNNDTMIGTKGIYCE